MEVDPTRMRSAPYKSESRVTFTSPKKEKESTKLFYDTLRQINHHHECIFRSVYLLKMSKITITDRKG